MNRQRGTGHPGRWMNVGAVPVPPSQTLAQRTRARPRCTNQCLGEGGHTRPGTAGAQGVCILQGLRGHGASMVTFTLSCSRLSRAAGLICSPATGHGPVPHVPFLPCVVDTEACCPGGAHPPEALRTQVKPLGVNQRSLSPATLVPILPCLVRPWTLEPQFPLASLGGP